MAVTVVMSILTALLLFAYPRAYKAAATAMAKRRRAAERDAVASLGIAADVPRPEDYADIAVINAAQADPHVRAVV